MDGDFGRSEAAIRLRRLGRGFRNRPRLGMTTAPGRGGRSFREVVPTPPASVEHTVVGRGTDSPPNSGVIECLSVSRATVDCPRADPRSDNLLARSTPAGRIGSGRGDAAAGDGMRLEASAAYFELISEHAASVGVEDRPTAAHGTQ